jgi:uncharacterized damage-inducible protein DinB
MALNNAWANRTLYGAIDGLAPETLAAPRPGFFPSLKETLNHILAVDLYYLDALEEGGQGRAVFRDEPLSTVADLARTQAATDLRLARFCSALTPETLARTRVTERREGPFEEEVAALLLHLFQHQIHHRGQAHVQVQAAGLAPPQLDEFHLVYDRAPTAQEYHR